MEKEKISQAIEILNEPAVDSDLWLVIDKESEVMTDPIMDFIIGTGVTWLSFFMFFKSGQKYAIVGNLDIEKIKRLALFDEIFTYKGSPAEDLLKLLRQHDPRKIAINFSKDSPPADGLTYGRYLNLLDLLSGTEYAGRLVSAENIIARVRGRKSAEEIARIKQAIAVTLQIYD
ncbi:MAG: aminopeptidase P family protein, partial [Candidatus Aminicenantes bacterium]|nr:aminopeptidase P family protein [Candidatus Aminicenantes bacterium]